ncbi:hypothetical protein LSH36_905g00000 [Paralvinella palmiformis]|uniref:Fucosyltransferase n=1 Tax=Paralvinella palmiformis TaxID=53620 RepID=A0AAD9IYT8_9ANNE|nr:hypothetical protein LSH36_905g00000 [Paralvinella palmiformis]
MVLDDATDEGNMRTNTRIMTLWAGVILIWTCCLFMTCLFLNDVICAEEELCDHDDDVSSTGGGVRKLGIYKEYYEDLANDSDFADVIELRSTHRVVVLYRKDKKKTWTIPEGDYVFRHHRCSISKCVLSHDIAEQATADAVLLRAADIRSRDDLPDVKPTKQIWLLTMTQPPDQVRGNLSTLNGLVNWTSTYSNASDIQRPFGIYRSYDERENSLGTEWEQIILKWTVDDKNASATTNVGRKPPRDAQRWNSSLLTTKSRLVAMFTDDCKLPPHHKAYVDQLAKHIRVDLYGKCKQRSCGTRKRCLQMLRTSYKFYLAFEDSSCHQYITDRFWHVALGNNVVPIVMGPPRTDYELLAPPESFIHVSDFSTPADLASHLLHLARDGSLYERLFDWKWQGYVRHSTQLFGDQNFWCHLCARLHDRRLIGVSQVYDHLDKWWSYHRQCRAD